MKKSVMQKWVKALRSGKYKKAKGQLKDDDSGGYCCLGVLCEISGKKYEGWNNFPPAEVLDWAGLKSESGELTNRKSKNGFNELTTINDRQTKKGFKYIASIIEKHYKKL